jgi:hypothetical protein
VAFAFKKRQFSMIERKHAADGCLPETGEFYL